MADFSGFSRRTFLHAHFLHIGCAYIVASDRLRTLATYFPPVVALCAVAKNFASEIVVEVRDSSSQNEASGSSCHPFADLIFANVNGRRNRKFCKCDPLSFVEDNKGAVEDRKKVGWFLSRVNYGQIV